MNTIYSNISRNDDEPNNSYTDYELGLIQDAEQDEEIIALWETSKGGLSLFEFAAKELGL